MVEGYNALAGTQTDINRRLLRRIEALENAEAGEAIDISALEDAVKDIQDEIGADDEATTIKGRIKALEDA